MAADWRGWRLIVVNGERYRWRGESCCPCCNRLNFGPGERLDRVRVRCEANPSRLLTVDYGLRCMGFVLPHNVEEWIVQAQERGWPDESRTLELRFADQPGVPNPVVVS